MLQNLDFQGSEASRAPFLKPKIDSKTTWKPRARRSPLRESKNRFRSALGEPPGPKKNFGNFAKRPGGIFGALFQKQARAMEAPLSSAELETDRRGGVGEG